VNQGPTPVNLSLEPVVEAYSPGAVWMMVALPYVVTAIAVGMNYLFEVGPFYFGLEGVALVTGFVVLQGPLNLWVGARFRRGDTELWPYWVQSAVQLLWLCFLAWYSSAAVGLVCMCLFFTAALSDTRYFFRAPHLKRQYLYAFPTAALDLLLVDAFGGHGIVWMGRNMPDMLFARLAVAGLLLGIVQVIIYFSGEQYEALEESRRLAEEQQVAKAVAERERRVVRQTTALLHQGLTASKFSHDIASPASVIAMCAEELRACGVLGSHQDVLDDLIAASDRVRAMSLDLAKAVRDGPDARLRSVRELVDSALEQAAVTAASQGVVAPAPELAIQACDVWATPQHASTIANVMVNGMLAAQERRLELFGADMGDRYELRIRDYGVSSVDRPDAMRRVRAAFEFLPGQSRSEYRGLGLSLQLARIHMVQGGGWIDVAAPADGPGLILVLHFALRNPDEDEPLCPEMSDTRANRVVASS